LTIFLTQNQEKQSLSLHKLGQKISDEFVNLFLLNYVCKHRDCFLDFFKNDFLYLRGL